MAARSRPGGPEPQPALVVVDKPAGLSSHDVVARLRRLAGTRRVGHAGTLDPMATGVLVCGVGRATRLLTYLVGADKEYTAGVRLGVGTLTDDAEGEPVLTPGAADLHPATVTAAMAALTGPLLQVPSAVSAIKVDGRRSYARVRAGEQVELAARPVTVQAFDLLDLVPGEVHGVPVVDLRVHVRCSSGTYVRALARDLGQALSSAGHLTALRRTRVGAFVEDDARSLTELEQDWQPVPAAEAAARLFPVRRLTGAEVAEVAHGRRLTRSDQGTGPVAALDGQGELVALLEDRDGTARPVLVLRAADGTVST